MQTAEVLLHMAVQGPPSAGVSESSSFSHGWKDGGGSCGRFLWARPMVVTSVLVPVASQFKPGHTGGWGVVWLRETTKRTTLGLRHGSWKLQSGVTTTSGAPTALMSEFDLMS